MCGDCDKAHNQQLLQDEILTYAGRENLTSDRQSISAGTYVVKGYGDVNQPDVASQESSGATSLTGNTVVNVDVHETEQTE